MSAIWHDHGQPSWLAIAPSFSFHNIAEITQPAPESYAKAMAEMRSWEEFMGCTYYQEQGRRAWALWQIKKPWWL
jgi:hypothetical protein